jgi:hypothetical protein
MSETENREETIRIQRLKTDMQESETGESQRPFAREPGSCAPVWTEECNSVHQVKC